MVKKYEEEESDPLYPIYTFMEPNLTGTAENGKADLSELIGNQHGLDTVKPVQLIKYLVSTFSGPEDTILDFFAGSCTTAHAIEEINQEENSSRRFILVQIPEQISQDSEASRAGFKTIADIGKKRLRLLPAKLNSSLQGYICDFGFKVFKLDSSNIRSWDPNRSDLEQTLLDHAEHLVEGRSEEDVLYELLLKRGVDLSTPIESKEFGGKKVYSIGYGVLFACLDKSIKSEDVETLSGGIIKWNDELNQDSETTIVFRDSAFSDDVTKTNMSAILNQGGIANVRSL